MPSRSRSRSRSSSQRSEDSSADRRRDRKSRQRSRSPPHPDRRAIDEAVKDAIATHMGTYLSQHFSQDPRENQNTADYNAEIQNLKAKQETLDIEAKAASLNSNGGQSQYRCIASLKMKMKKASARLEEALLLFDSTEDKAYAAIAPVRDELESAIRDAEERLDLIIKADADPKTGWKALTLYESKQKAGKIDPEKEKVFNSCLREAQEDAKRKAKTTSTFNYKKPFRQGPGAYPGNSSGQGYSGWMRTKRHI